MRYPKQSTHLAWRSMGELTVIIDLGADRLFHELNEVGSFIWKLCDGTRDEAAIAERLVEEFEVSGPTASTEVSEFLRMLDGMKLISWTS